MWLMESPGYERLGPLVHDVARLLRRSFERRISDGSLSATQGRALILVAKSEGMPQARLADLLEIEPISVSRLLDRMEDGGWVERRPDPTDRRVRSVYPTDKSRAVLHEVRSVAGDVYEEALKGLSPDERKALIHGLQVMSENLSDGAALACQADAKVTA
ncbi:MarR family winged helix-turn-helix transcriptional regulator [Mesorhizobium liriopis]|jgi:MarR family transcriptional regulator, transcriptional regulator for hemolysin